MVSFNIHFAGKGIYDYFKNHPTPTQKKKKKKKKEKEKKGAALFRRKLW